MIAIDFFTSILVRINGSAKDTEYPTIHGLSWRSVCGSRETQSFSDGELFWSIWSRDLRTSHEFPVHWSHGRLGKNRPGSSGNPCGSHENESSKGLMTEISDMPRDFLITKVYFHYRVCLLTFSMQNTLSLWETWRSLCVNIKWQLTVWLSGGNWITRACGKWCGSQRM